MSWQLAIMMLDAFMLKGRREGWKAMWGVLVYERAGGEDTIYGEGAIRAVEEGRGERGRERVVGVVGAWF